MLFEKYGQHIPLNRQAERYAREGVPLSVLMLHRAETRFDVGRNAALSALRRATVVASDKTGVRIEGTNSYHGVFRCVESVHRPWTKLRCALL